MSETPIYDELIKERGLLTEVNDDLCDRFANGVILRWP
jgi:hypothetical protein